jgi:hypothetical protein
VPGTIQSAEYMQLERLIRIYPRSCSAHIWRLAQMHPARNYGEFHKRRRARTVAAPRARTLRPHLGCPTSYRVDERSRFRRRPAQRRPRWISAPRCVIGAMTPTLRRWSPHRSTVPTLPMRWGPPVSGARASLRLSGALDFGWWTGAFAAGRQVPDRDSEGAGRDPGEPHPACLIGAATAAQREVIDPPARRGLITLEACN